MGAYGPHLYFAMKPKKKLKVKKIANLVIAIVTIFTLAVFVVTFAQNIIARASETYAYYFNDSRVVNKIYTAYSNNEMADAIANYFNSIGEEPFELLEYTGYDNESIFSPEDGENMLIVKKALGKSAIACGVCLVLTLAAFIYLVKNNKKKLLRDMSRIGELLALGLIALQAKLALTLDGHLYMQERLGMPILPENSQLATILTHDFVHMAGIAFIGIALVIWIAVVYFTHLATRQEKIFKKRQ